MQLFVYFLDVDTVEQDVFDVALLVHTHILYFGALEDVVALGLVQDALQVVRHVMPDVLIVVALESFFILFRPFLDIFVAVLHHSLDLLSLPLHLVDFLNKGVVSVAAVVILEHVILRNAQQTQLNLALVDGIDQFELVLAAH